MEISRRELLRIGSAALVSASLPMAGFGLVPGKRPKVEVHFTGKHEFGRIMAEATANDWAKLPIGEVMGKVGLYLLDTPYVGYTLDHSADHEFCIVNLQELDCVTFVESTLALSRIIKSGHSDMRALPREIERIRYRDGKCDGFCSRLHYTSDWLYDNERKGLIERYTRSLKGSVEIKETVSLMSTRPELYLQLRAHPEFVPEIRKDEEAIDKRTYYKLPKDAVKAAELHMQTGDIIAITTSAKILDCAHIGLAYRDDKGLLHFLHASSKHGKVTLDAELCEYLDSIHSFTGVMLARPLAPA
jgi:hypothetical protein